MHCLPPVCGSSAGSPGCVTVRQCSRAPCATVCALADLKMNRLLNTIDEWRSRTGSPRRRRRNASLRRACPIRPACAWRSDDGRYGAVVWATGLRPNYSFVQLPVFDRRAPVAARRRRRRRARRLRPRARHSCAAASRVSSTAPRTTAANCRHTSPHTWALRHPPDPGAWHGRRRFLSAGGGVCCGIAYLARRNDACGTAG